MTRSIAVIVLLVLSASGIPADKKDPVKDKLIAAKVAYDTKIKEFQKEVDDWFDTREDAARFAGDKKAVDQLKAERDSYDADGELPKTAPAALRQKQVQTRKTLEATYTEAVKEYTKDSKDSEAAAVEAELNYFLAKINPVNLLALIDPKKHTLVGEWKMHGASLVGSGTGKRPSLQLPYEPGEEYDLEVTCKRLGGDDHFCVGLVAGNRQVLALIDGTSKDGQGRVSGLHLVDQKNSDDNATTVKGQRLKLNQTNTIIYSVRAGKIEVSFNGKVITSFKGDFSRLSLMKQHAVPNKKALFLYMSPKSSFQIDRIVVTPMKGKGKILR